MLRTAETATATARPRYAQQPHSPLGSALHGQCARRSAMAGRESRGGGCLSRGGHGESIPNSRSRSSSSFHAPTDARSQGRPECYAGSPLHRRAARARPPGRRWRRRPACVSPRGATFAPRSASSSARRAASVRARSCTASQPAVSSSPDGRQRAGDRLGAQRQAVEAPRVLVQPRLEARRWGRRGCGSRAVRPPAARAEPGLTYSMPVPSGPHSHFCPAPA